MNTDNVKSMISGVKAVLITAAGLLIVAEIIFGNVGLNVVGNLQALLDGFIGSGASLVSVITGIVVLGLLGD
jgi:hypothetical protein